MTSMRLIAITLEKSETLDDLYYHCSNLNSTTLYKKLGLRLAILSQCHARFRLFFRLYFTLLA